MSVCQWECLQDATMVKRHALVSRWLFTGGHADSHAAEAGVSFVYRRLQSPSLADGANSQLAETLVSIAGAPACGAGFTRAVNRGRIHRALYFTYTFAVRTLHNNLRITLRRHRLSQDGC